MDNLPNDIMRYVCTFFEPIDVSRSLINRKLASQADLFYASIVSLCLIDQNEIDDVLRKCTGLIHLKTDKIPDCPMTKLKKLNAYRIILNERSTRIISQLALEEITIQLKIVAADITPVLSNINTIHAAVTSSELKKFDSIPFTSLIISNDDQHSELCRINPTKLKHLDLFHFDGFPRNLNLSEMSLESLDITCAVDDPMFSLFDLSLVAHMPLKKLSINNEVVKIPYISSLRSLYLTNCTVNLSELNTLNLDNLKLVCCQTAGVLSNTKHLELHETDFIEHKDLNLKSLDMQHIYNHDLSMFTELEFLHVGGGRLAIESLPLTITALDLNELLVTTESMRHIARMPLRSLKLCSCGIKGQDLALISHLKLHTLDITDNDIDFEYLGLLRNMKLQTFKYGLKNDLFLLKMN